MENLVISGTLDQIERDVKGLNIEKDQMAILTKILSDIEYLKNALASERAK